MKSLLSRTTVDSKFLDSLFKELHNCTSSSATPDVASHILPLAPTPDTDLLLLVPEVILLLPFSQKVKMTLTRAKANILGRIKVLTMARQKASIRRGLQHDLSLEELENQRPTKIARSRIYHRVFGGSKEIQWRRYHSYESTMLPIPFSVKPLDERFKTLCGVIESYELEFEHDNFVPLLLSRRQIKEFTCRKDYAGKNMVVVAVV